MSAMDVQPFDFDGMQVRVVMREGEPWWVHVDACRGLGIVDANQASERLREDEKGVVEVQTSAGKQRIRVVNESGLYRLIFRSNTKDAERFKVWVTHEVLPTIRKTGSYLAPNVAPAMPKTFAEALRALADQVEETEALAARLEVVEPPALAWSAMADTSRDFSVGDAAKILSRDPSIETGEIRLFRTLVEFGLLFVGKDDRGRKVYKPYQEHVDAGRLALRMGSTWEHPKTHERETGNPQARITVKGLAYLHRKMGGTGTLMLQAVEPTALTVQGAAP
jgi:anti-repressor protein